MKCVHPELNFASGDYYVTCAQCAATWVNTVSIIRVV